jgi:hypothetical protein
MTIDELIENFKVQQAQANQEKERLEAEFSDTKLNPYGITTIDFSKRQEQYELILKLQGAIEGLELAKTECSIS